MSEQKKICRRAARCVRHRRRVCRCLHGRAGVSHGPAWAFAGCGLADGKRCSLRRQPAQRVAGCIFSAQPRAGLWSHPGGNVRTAPDWVWSLCWICTRRNAACAVCTGVFIWLSGRHLRDAAHRTAASLKRFESTKQEEFKDVGLSEAGIVRTLGTAVCTVCAGQRTAQNQCYTSGTK